MNRTYTLILIGFGVMLGVLFGEIVIPRHGWFITEMHKEVLAGIAGSPYRYRILGFGLVEMIRQFLPGAYDDTILSAFTIAHVIAFPVMLLVVRGWFARWMNADRANTAALMLAAVIPLGFLTWSVSIYTPLEMISLALAGLLLLQRPTPRVRAAYGVLMFISILNRETGGLLALMWVLWHWGSRRELRFGAILILVFLVEYMGLRLLLGNVPHQYTLGNTWDENAVMTITQAARNNLLILPLYVCTALAWRRSDARLRRLTIAAGVYLVAAFLFGIWHEVRMQFPIFVLLLPLVFGNGDTP